MNKRSTRLSYPMNEGEKEHNKQQQMNQSNLCVMDATQNDVCDYNNKHVEATMSNEYHQPEELHNQIPDKYTERSYVKEDQQEVSHDSNNSNTDMSHTKQIHSSKGCNIKPKMNLSTYVNKFLQQSSAFSWFTQQFDRSIGSDHFKNLVVRSTFPVNLVKSDFEYYIDMTFNDFSPEFKIRMKDLYSQSNDNPISEDFIINDSSDGAISATLIQILSHKNDHNELEMLVGAVNVIRYPSRNHCFNRKNWERHQEQIKKALQYLYGKEALKELF